MRGEQAQRQEIRRRNTREVGAMNEVALVRAAHLLIAANLILVLARSAVGSRPARRRSRFQRECDRLAEANDFYAGRHFPKESLWTKCRQGATVTNLALSEGADSYSFLLNVLADFVLLSRDVTRQNDKGDRHDRCDDLLHNVHGFVR